MIGIVEENLIFFDVFVVTADVRVFGSIKTEISSVTSTQRDDFGTGDGFIDGRIKKILNDF